MSTLLAPAAETFSAFSPQESAERLVHTELLDAAYHALDLTTWGDPAAMLDEFNTIARCVAVNARTAHERQGVDLCLGYLRYMLFAKPGDPLPAGMAYARAADFNPQAVGNRVVVNGSLQEAAQFLWLDLQDAGLKNILIARQQVYSPADSERCNNALTELVRNSSTYAFLYSLCGEAGTTKTAERPLTTQERERAEVVIRAQVGAQQAGQSSIARDPAPTTVTTEFSRVAAATLQRRQQEAAHMRPLLNPTLRRALGGLELATVSDTLEQPTPMQRLRQVITEQAKQYIAARHNVPYDMITNLTLTPQLDIIKTNFIAPPNTKMTVSVVPHSLALEFQRTTTDPTNAPQMLLVADGHFPRGLRNLINGCLRSNDTDDARALIDAAVATEVTELREDLQGSILLHLALVGTMYLYGRAFYSNILSTRAALLRSPGPTLTPSRDLLPGGRHDFLDAQVRIPKREVAVMGIEEFESAAQIEIGNIEYDRYPGHERTIIFGPPLDPTLPLHPVQPPDLTLNFASRIFNGHEPLLENYKLIAASQDSQAEWQQFHYQFRPTTNQAPKLRFGETDLTGLHSRLDELKLAYLQDKIGTTPMSVDELAAVVRSNSLYAFYNGTFRQRNPTTYEAYVHDGVLAGTCNVFANVGADLTRTLGATQSWVAHGVRLPRRFSLSDDSPVITAADLHSVTAYAAPGQQTRYADFTPPADFRTVPNFPVRLSESKVRLSVDRQPISPVYAALTPSDVEPLTVIPPSPAVLRNHAEEMLQSLIPVPAGSSITQAALLLSEDDPARRLLESFAFSNRQDIPLGQRQACVTQLLDYLARAATAPDRHQAAWGRSYSAEQIATLTSFARQLLLTLKD